MPRYTCLLHIDAPDGTIAEQMHTAIGVFIAEMNNADEIEAARASLCDLSASERDSQIRALAKEQHHRDGEVEIDDGAAVSEGQDNGAYVQAWVWTSFAGAGSFFLAMVAAAHLLDRWSWAAAIDPRLYLAHELLQKIGG